MSQYQSHGDAEAGTQRGVDYSQNGLTPTVETDPISQSEKNYPGPGAASTMSPSPAGMTGSSTGPGAGHPSHDSMSGTNGTVVADDAGNDSHPRQRKKGLLARFGKKSKEDGPERRTTSDSKKNKQKFTFVGQLKATLLNSWINILLVAVPVGIALNYAHVNPVIIFVVNFIAIIPLAALLSYATEEIALRTGETIGGLLNASFGSVYISPGVIMSSANRETQQCGRGHSLCYRPYQARSSDCQNIVDWKYSVQSVASHGHVLLLWWHQSC